MKIIAFMRQPLFYAVYSFCIVFLSRHFRRNTFELPQFFLRLWRAVFIINKRHFLCFLQFLLFCLCQWRQNIRQLKLN